MSFGFDSKLGTAAAMFLLFSIPAHAAPQQNAAANAKASGKSADAAAKPTPHLANGHLDLNGVWYPWSGHVIRSDGQSKEGVGETLKDGSIIATYAYDRRYNTPSAAPARTRAKPSLPSYKPELAAKVQDLEARQNQTDPSFACLGPGVPRIGPPHQIVQSDRNVVFIYSDVIGNFWRIIPTDGTPHNADADPSYFGDSIGHWVGDTLVVDDTNFNDETWMGDGGYFHSTALHVTERLTRHGDTLLYEVTVEDPNVLTEPWKLQPRTLNLSDTPLEEAPPCKEMDRSHFTTLEHHGVNR
jgi:hypothetical protein